MPASAVTTKRLPAIESNTGTDCSNDGPDTLIRRPDFVLGSRRFGSARETLLLSNHLYCSNLSLHRNVDIVVLVRVEPVPVVLFPARPRINQRLLPSKTRSKKST
jgi:hypothetical protein